MAYVEMKPVLSLSEDRLELLYVFVIAFWSFGGLVKIVRIFFSPLLCELH